MHELACALLLLSAGCSALAPHSRLPPRIEYAAFSFARPADPSWSLSERAVPGELDPRLYAEGEAILDSVTLDER